MSDIVKMRLYAGPHDGEEIEIHRDNLKIFPRLSVENEKGEVSEYALDNDGRFVFLPAPNDPRVARGVFVCDDDGNVISEKKNFEDALDKLEQLEQEKEDDGPDEA